MKGRRLDKWQLDWSKIIQIKKTVRKTGSYTITIMVAKPYNNPEHVVQILNAIKGLIE